MADDYKIRITTEADTSGVKETQEALKDTTSAARESEKAMVDGAAKATAGTEKQTEALKETAQAAREAAAAVDSAKKSADDLAAAPVARKPIRPAASTAGVSAAAAATRELKKEAAEAASVVGDVATGAGLAAGLSSLHAAALGVVGGFTAAGAALNSLVTEGNAKTKELLNLNTALVQMGQYTPETSAKIQELADSFAKLTNTDGGPWSDAAATLLRFHVAASELPSLYPILEGLAGRLGGDVNQAAEVLGRVLVGNTRLLNQFGVEVSETATRAERLAAITQLAATGQGVLRANAQTLEGRMNALSFATTDLVEKLGLLVTTSDTANDIVRFLTFTVNFWADQIPDAEDKTGDLALQQADLAAEAQKAAGAVGGVGKAASGSSLGMEGAATSAQNLSEKLEAARREAELTEQSLQNIEKLKTSILEQTETPEDRQQRLLADSRAKTDAFASDFNLVMGRPADLNASPAKLVNEIANSKLTEPIKEGLLTRLKEMVDAGVKLQDSALSDITKQIQNRAQELEQTLGSMQEGGPEWKNTLQKIAQAKKDLLDLELQKKALQSAVSDADKQANALAKQKIDSDTKSQIGEAEDKLGATRTSPLSARPQTTYRQRDNSGHIIRRGKIISRGPGRNGEELEPTDFSDALRPGQIDTAPRMRRAEPMLQGGTNSGSLESAAQGTKAAADTQSQAATTYEQATGTFATAAQTMNANAGNLLGVVQGLASAVRGQESQIASLRGIVNRLASQQGGSGS